MSSGQPEDETCTLKFDFGIRLGLVLIMEAACLSAASVAGLLAYIGVSSRTRSPMIPHVNSRWTYL